MQETQMKNILAILPVGAAMLLFTFLLLLHRSYHPERKFLKSCEEFAGFIRGKSRESPWYHRTELWLCKNGAVFHFGTWMTPISYLAMRLVGAMLGFTAVFRLGAGYGVLAGIALFFLPGILLSYLNKKDNEKMLPEMKLVYHALEIQIRAGVYVTDALAECYGSVQEKRLRQALLDLAGDIVLKADIFESLERFQGKFDNRYIDSLCITLLQALESGQAVELLSDIGEQIKDMETSVLERKKHALDRSITFYQLGVLAAVLGVALYACVTDMFAAAVQF